MPHLLLQRIPKPPPLQAQFPVFDVKSSCPLYSAVSGRASITDGMDSGCCCTRIYAFFPAFNLPVRPLRIGVEMQRSLCVFRRLQAHDNKCTSVRAGSSLVVCLSVVFRLRLSCPGDGPTPPSLRGSPQASRASSRGRASGLSMPA